MILIGFSSYPLQSQKEVAKRLMELPRLPEFIKGKGNYGYVTIDGGCQGIQIYEFEDARAEEANLAIHKAYMAFYNIPGYKYEVKQVSRTREIQKWFLESFK